MGYRRTKAQKATPTYFAVFLPFASRRLFPKQESMARSP